MAILRAVWNFITFGFSKSPSIGLGKPGFRYKQKRQAIGAAKGDGKIAAIVDDIGK